VQCEECELPARTVLSQGGAPSSVNLKPIVTVVSPRALGMISAMRIIQTSLLGGPPDP